MAFIWLIMLIEPHNSKECAGYRKDFYTRKHGEEMFILLKRLFILIGLMSVSVSANAITIPLDFGTLSPGQSANVTEEDIPAGMHTVRIDFDITGAPVGGIQAVGGTFTFNGPNGGVVINGAQLVDEADPMNPTGINFQNVDGLGGAIIASLSSFDVNLMNGSYFVEIFIEATGTNADIDGQIDVAAIPLPAALWLFGSALVGFFSFNGRTQKLVA